MAGAAHAPIGGAAIVRSELRALGTVQRAREGAHAQLLHRVREEAHRPIALHSVLAQLCPVPASWLTFSAYSFWFLQCKDEHLLMASVSLVIV